MAGLSDTGFEIIRLPEIIEQHNEDAQSIFEDLVEVGDTVDVSADATLGRLIALISPSEAIIWEQLQSVWDAFNPNAAYGIALDNVEALSGITRLEASKSRAYVLLSGLIGTVIPAGTPFSATSLNASYSLEASVQLSASAAISIDVTASTVANNSEYTVGVVWNEAGARSYTITSSAAATAREISEKFKAAIDADPMASMSAVVLDSGVLRLTSASNLATGTFSVSPNLSIPLVTKLGTATSLEYGSETIPANTLTGISVPVSGFLSVTNPFASVPGRQIETDEELRNRARNSKFQRATNIIEALYSELLGVSGVNQVEIYENDTSVIDAKGVLPHGFLVLITGGFAQDIAYAIWNNKPTGINSQGNVAVEIEDDQGYAREIRFSRPDYVDVYVTMDIEKTALFPADGETLIRNALEEYTASSSMGKEVIYSRLYTPINSVPGHYINSLKIGTTPSPSGESNIPMDFDQVARILPQNVIFT